MKSVADWLQRRYTEAVLMETGMRRNECMKRLSKVSCGLLLTASLLIGAMLSGCGQTTDYTAEIREYQNKLESLAAENEVKVNILDICVSGPDPRQRIPFYTYEYQGR